MKTSIAISVLVSVCLTTGCDPITRHKVLTTVFDGVPSLPPPEQICAEYAEKKITELKNEESRKSISAGTQQGTGSVHLPYQEKKCDDCHDKSKEDGFKRPLKELCLICHTDFIKGSFIHGPVAVGDCLFCHLPHNASQPALLKKTNNSTCSACHRENRVASGLHKSVSSHEILCTDCHNPHEGNTPYFLK